MTDAQPPEHRPTTAEQLSGVFGCLALLVAVILFFAMFWWSGCLDPLFRKP